MRLEYTVHTCQECMNIIFLPHKQIMLFYNRLFDLIIYKKTKYPTSCDMKVVSNVVNIDKFNQLTPKDKSFYIIDLCQQAIMSLVYEMQWNTEVFERTYDKIISMGGLFREYWAKGKEFA